MAAARDAVAAAPRSAEAHYLAGFAAENLGDLSIARTAYETAASLAPRMADAAARLAALAARRGDWPRLAPVPPAPWRSPPATPPPSSPW